MESSCILFGGLGLRLQMWIKIDLCCHDGYVAVVSEHHNRTPSNEVSSVYDVKLDPWCVFPGGVYPIQLNRIERMRLESDLLGLGSRHFHHCLSLQQLWPPEVGGMK